MAERATAEARLARILLLLPLAGRDGGIGMGELARRLGVSRDDVLRDIEELTTRDYYHPAGSVNEIQVGLEEDRVRVWTGGQFQRPVRLDLREAAALHLGLRLLATEREEPALLETLRSLEERIAWAVPDDVDSRIELAGDAGSADALRALLVRAAKERRRCRLEYLKPGAAPEPRTVDPYIVVYSSGRWYLIGYCHDRREPRVFRVDRVLEARLLDDRFEPPAEFDPADYLSGDRVFRGGEELEVTVRYGPRAAPWLIERGEGEAQPDGSVVVRHEVVDPDWIVRHVLQYGEDAGVVGPREVRAAVRAGVERVLDAQGRAGERIEAGRGDRREADS